jgi:ABC-2 type transport system ATP-binding protein
VAAKRDELVDRFRLGEKANVTAMQLSRGMQQKLALACAVVVDAPVLLLDEPTLGLDVETSYELRQYLQSLAGDDGRCVIVSSHDMQLVSDVCGRVVIITAGKVVADDTVDALVGVFRAIAVRFSLAAPLPPGGDAAMQRFGAHQAVDETGRTTIDVTVADSGAFYELIGALREAGAVIERVDGAAPDLEDVFLSILKGNRS